MIYDVFTFFNEVDLLELRFRELESVVDVFVIVEGTRTHRGEPKPAYFQENIRRFRPWMNKIIYYLVNDPPGGDRNDLEATWCRDFHQRDCIKRVLPVVEPDDIVLHTDADEIVRADAVRNYSIEQGIAALQMRFYHFYLNYQSNGAWELAIACPGSVYNSLPPSKLRYLDHRYPSYYTVNTFLPDAGWHFSYLGGVENIKLKLRSYLHWDGNHTLPTLAAIQAGQDVNLQELTKQSDQGFHTFDRVEVDSGMPLWVQQNTEHYKKLGFIL